MQRYLNHLRLLALVSAIAISCGSCGWREREPRPENQPEPIAADAPAEVALLTDEAAQSFLEGTWPASGEQASRPPSDGRVVVAGGDKGVALAYVLGRNEVEAREQLDLLTVSGDVPGCEPGGGNTCCDEERGFLVLDGEYEGERFWLSLGVSCKSSPVQEGRMDGEPPADRPRADYIEVEPRIWDMMVARGVKHPFMTLAKDNHELQVLVDPSEQIGELQPPPVTHRLRFQDGLPIILADHVDPPPRPPGYCADSVDYCKDVIVAVKNADRHQAGTPHTARHHWYVWRQNKQKWCEKPWIAKKCPRM